MVGDPERVVVVSGDDIRALSQHVRAFTESPGAPVPNGITASHEDTVALVEQAGHIYGDGILVNFDMRSAAYEKPCIRADASAMRALMGSPFSLSEAIAAAPYAAQERARIVLTDHNDLDSMVEAITTLRALPDLEEVIFVGGNYWFNDSDKTVLTRARDTKALS